MRIRDIFLAFSAIVLGACASAPPPAAPAPICPAAPAPSASAAPAVVAAPAVEKLAPDAAFLRLFTSPTVDPAWFAASFLAEVPAKKVQSHLETMKKELGEPKKVEKKGDGYRIVLAKGSVPGRIGLDEQGRIVHLWLGEPELSQVPPIAETMARFRELPGKLSVIVTTDGKSVAELDPDASLAVGSSFKLAVLLALRERIDAKKAAWPQIVKLEPRRKMLFGGALRYWPDGAQLTVETLATLMISESDNTATDVLIELVGRAPIEKLAPGNAPFLMTRDATLLKAKGNEELLGRWRKADEAARRLMQGELEKAPLPSIDAFPDTPTALDVEWMFSVRRLCDLAGRTKDLPLTRVSPGLATRKDWDLVAYKGGSEPGVRNYTTWVEKGGKKHCVSATWNHDRDLDEKRLDVLYRALLSALHEQ